MVFPLIVKGQREAAKLNNHMPQITKLTTRMNEAKQAGNKFECKFVTFADVYISPQEYRITITLWGKMLWWNFMPPSRNCLTQELVFYIT